MKLLLLLCVTLSFDCPTLVPADQWPEEVSTCPVTPQDWRERAEFKSCPTSESYHCIRANDNKFYEVCLANDHVKATEEGGCPQIKFIGNRFDLYPEQYECNVTNGACPATGTTFNTDELYKYPGCFPPVIAASTSSTPKNSIGTGETVGIVVGVICGIAICISVVVFCLWRKCKKSNSRHKQNGSSSTGNTNGNIITNGHHSNGGSYSQVHQRRAVDELESTNLVTDNPPQVEENGNLSESQNENNGHAGGGNITYVYNVNAENVQIGDGSTINQS